MLSEQSSWANHIKHMTMTVIEIAQAIPEKKNKQKDQ